MSLFAKFLFGLFPKSLRTRLLLGTLVWVFITILLAGFGLVKIFEKHQKNQLFSELNLHLDQLTAGLELNAAGELELSYISTDPRFDLPLSGFYWQIEAFDDNSSKVQQVLLSRSLWDQNLVSSQQFNSLIALETTENEPLYGVLRQVFLEDLQVVLAVGFKQTALLAPINEFQSVLWISLSVLGLGLLLAALIQVRLGIKPLKFLQQDLSQVRAGKQETLQNTYPSEIAPLVAEFNQVLAQNAANIDRAKTQAGNLAHGLKTPLAVLLNAANSSSQTDISTLKNQVIEQVNKAQQQVDYHLNRARAAAMRKPHATCEILPLVQGLVRVMQKVYAEKNLQFLLDIPADLQFKGEKSDLEEMLGNLLDNAAKWAVGKIWIRANTSQNKLNISIQDDGPGLVAEEIAQVLQRWVRLDERKIGSGLGLNIVNDLAEDYQGSLQLLPTKGLTAMLNF